jgi:hypothetical protein
MQAGGKIGELAEGEGILPSARPSLCQDLPHHTGNFTLICTLPGRPS